MILFGITYKLPNGLRTLMSAAQGRFMSKTREEAEGTLEKIFKNNGEDRLAQIFGEQSKGTFRVDPFDCYEHGDPKGIYVDD